MRAQDGREEGGRGGGAGGGWRGAREHAARAAERRRRAALPHARGLGTPDGDRAANQRRTFSLTRALSSRRPVAVQNVLLKSDPLHPLGVTPKLAGALGAVRWPPPCIVGARAPRELRPRRFNPRRRAAMRPLPRLGHRSGAAALLP